MLDTHAWIWWVADPARLSSAAKRAIEKARVRGVCAISVWELAVLIERGRLVLDREVTDWVRDALALPGVELLPLTPEIALAAGGAVLELHGDPADRMIAATALAHRARLVTKDERLRVVRTLDTVW
ncbi:MAG TPA: type II toxin-antitoxin system VapC family toxin [Myxococcales bacterium]